MTSALSAAGGTSLAPVPAHPHQLSREPSKEDLEMAEQLKMLNHAQDRHPMPRDPQARSESSVSAPEIITGAPSPADISEYHSLDDTLQYHPPPGSSQQPEQMPTPAMSVSMPSQDRFSVANAPVTGQVCR